LTGDAELRTRFLQEAQAAAALSHANPCTVYEIEGSSKPASTVP
jgi:hypothetical protein